MMNKELQQVALERKGALKVVRPLSFDIIPFLALEEVRPLSSIHTLKVARVLTFNHTQSHGDHIIT